MTTDISDQPNISAATRQEAAWARMEDVVRAASTPPPAHPRPPSPPSPKARRGARGRRRRRRWFIGSTTAVALVALAATAVFVALPRYRSTASTPAAAVAPGGAMTDTRLESATSDALAATAAERAGLASLTGIPTPASVATVTNAYAASLRLYLQVLKATPVPVRARAEAAAAKAQAGANAARLEGVDRLPPILLGAFMRDFANRTDRLQQRLASLERSLHATPQR